MKRRSKRWRTEGGSNQGRFKILRATCWGIGSTNRRIARIRKWSKSWRRRLLSRCSWHPLWRRSNIMIRIQLLTCVRKLGIIKCSRDDWQKLIEIFAKRLICMRQISSKKRCKWMRFKVNTPLEQKSKYLPFSYETFP